MTTADLGIGIEWVADTQLVKAGFIHDVVRGANGWVAIGSCPSTATVECPYAWLSTDDRTWSGLHLPHRWPDVWASAVAPGRTGYVIAGSDRDLAASGQLPEEQRLTRIWTSSDGRTWKRVGALALADDFPLVAVAPNGTIIAGSQAYQRDADLFTSQDGREWRPLDPSAFGIDGLHVQHIESTSTLALLSGAECDTCEARVWSSTDGITWSPAWRFDTFRAGIKSVATDGHAVVATAYSCVDDMTCHAQLWASIVGERWTVRYEGAELSDPKVAFTGTTFVAIGMTSTGFLTLGSRDGMTWGVITSEGLPSGPNYEDCGPGWFTAWQETILLGTNPEVCWAFRGTVK